VRGGEPGTLKLCFWSRGVGGALLDLLVRKLRPFKAMGFKTGVVVSDLVPPVLWPCSTLLLGVGVWVLSFVDESWGADSFLRRMEGPRLMPCM
jgi:hypothetical protein